MNFFEQQHRARQHTRMLVVLFVLAVVAIVLAVNGTAAVLWRLTHGILWLAPMEPGAYPAHFFFTNTVLTVGLISAGTLIELFNLREGGDVVAQMVGGRLVSRATPNLQERRLLNVVDEMALAAHLTCPRVYLLAREDAINAFAAGYNPHEAVIAVTNGALTRLTRDELQGIVAHEFSHILNGDMRLNMRLIGVLFGIQMVAGCGQALMQWSPINRYEAESEFQADPQNARATREEKRVPVQVLFFVTGFTLFVVGYIGIVFGRLIKAAVSREREFLADASAIQFTRNADGLGAALQKISGLSRGAQPGSQIAHANAEQLSHLFLCAVKPCLVDGLFATHPPIAERLRRIFGHAVGLRDAPVLLQHTAPAPMLPDLMYAPSVPAHSDDASRSAVSFLAALHQELHDVLRDPHKARSLVYALLLDTEQPHDVQRKLLDSCVPSQGDMVTHLTQQLGSLPATARLPLLDLAMPALRQLALSERADVLLMVNRLIAADNRITLNEFVVQTILVRRLDPDAGRSVPVRYADLGALRDEFVLMLSLVSHVAARGSGVSAQAAFARGMVTYPDLQLRIDTLVPINELDFDAVRQALDRLVQLAPLGKPALIKALVAVACSSVSGAVLQPDCANILRAICSAIDAPLPPIVAASYRSPQAMTP